jgi:hypothetical protein
LLVLAQGDAVGESEPARHDARLLRGGVVFQHAAGGAALDDFQHARFDHAAEVLGAEPRRGVAEVDLAAARHRHRIGEADRVAVHAVRQHHHLAVRRDGDQTEHGIGADQVAGRVEVEAEHPPAGLREHLLVAAVRVHAQDLPAGDRNVQLAVAADRHMLGTGFALQLDVLQAGQPLVGRMRTDVAGWGRRCPGHRFHRHRPQREVCGQREHEQRQPGQGLLHVASSAPGCQRVQGSWMRVASSAIAAALRSRGVIAFASV